MTLNPPDRRSKIIMGVDDQADNLAILQAYVTGAGYSFISAHSGEECLMLLTRMTPRLVLLDIQMPGLNGFEVCKRIRSGPATARIPVAFLTSANSIDDVKAGIAAGGNDFILKPFEKDKLLARIERWASGR